MAQAKTGDTVKIHYTGTLDDGTTFDSSKGREPLEFTLGSGQVIAGFDQAITGMSVGEVRTTHIPAAEAYGARKAEMVAVVPRGQLPKGLTPKVGQQLHIRGEEGARMIVTVTAATEADVTLDGNHALAGKDLTFEIELVEVTP